MMLRSVASKVAWMARATTTVVGLAIMLALVLGVASTALGKNGQSVILGKANNVATRVTGLIGKVATGEAFLVKNPSGGSALGLQVNAGQAPLTVNADAGKATNLNADKLDDKDSNDFQQRVSSTCLPGSSIRSISQTGTVACEPDSISGRQIVEASTTFNNSSLKSVTAECPPGKIAISGGARYAASATTLLRDFIDDIALQGSRPDGSSAWIAEADFVGSGTPRDWRLIAYVVCITP